MEVTMKIYWFFFNGNKKHEFNYVSKSLKDVYGELEPKVVKMKKRSIDHTKFLAAINELKKSGGAIVIDKMERLFENKKNLPTYIYCIENKIDIRFIKSPQYNTNIYSDFNEDKLVVVHDILVIQLKTASQPNKVISDMKLSISCSQIRASIMFIITLWVYVLRIYGLMGQNSPDQRKKSISANIWFLQAKNAVKNLISCM